MTLRSLLCLFLAVLTATAFGAAHAAQPAPEPAILHVLNRLAFGPSSDDVQHLRAIGIDAYVEEQLDPQSIPENPELVRHLSELETLRLQPSQLFALYGPPRPAEGANPSPDEVKARRERARVILQQAAEARVLRAMLSRRQLQEVMVDFWFNHFNVFAGKGLDHLWVGAYEEEAIRPYALGKFRDLLLATARHPAMLFYLDNAQNAAPGSPGLRGKEAGSLNENYAREVMELHTLGVSGGYTQDDVVALARALTGWGLARRNLRDGNEPAVSFDPARHDFGPKLLLGQPLQASGAGEEEEALDRLARHPATAHHIAFELAQYFVADAPPPGLVDRLAARFWESDGDIRTVLRTLFASREFRDAAGAKYKTPYQFVVSAARAAGVEVRNPRPLLVAMGRLGMPIYGCQTPDGYKNTEEAWLSPDATTLRISFATAFARGNLPVAAIPPTAPSPAPASPVAVPGAGDPAPSMPVAASAAGADQGVKGEPVDAGRLERLLGPSLGERTRAVISEAPAPLRAALLLGSPDFMRH